MESINKVDDIIRISKKMGIPREWVKSIVNSYITYVYNKVINGETVSFLRICDFRTKGYIGNKETLGFISNEVAKELGYSGLLVKSVLLYYEDIIASDIKRYRRHVINGLVKIGIEETYGNRLVITSSRSYTLKGVPNLVLSVRGSFKRKVGV